MIRIFVLLVGGLTWVCAASSQAQDPVLLQLYGKGVQEYFSGDYTKAFEQLTSAIASGSRDPRVYYFRGLAYLKFGKKPEAEMDFRKGAELESRDVNKYYNVGRALERVQGTDRQLLESYRVQARMIAYAESEKIRKTRYEALKREEARVLLQQAAEGTTPANESAESIPAPAAEGTGAGAAAEPKADAAGDSGEEKKTIEKKAGEPRAESATEDPFSAKPSEEKKPAVEEKPAADSKPTGKSIFGTLLKKAADAGSKVAAPKAGAAEKPAEKEMPADKPAENKEAQPADPFAK
jgi:tetratricopeptide (TPR) repeat protein